jgi:hypothetical protein
MGKSLGGSVIILFWYPDLYPPSVNCGEGFGMVSHTWYIIWTAIAGVGLVGTVSKLCSAPPLAVGGPREGSNCVENMPSIHQPIYEQEDALA